MLRLAFLHMHDAIRRAHSLAAARSGRRRTSRGGKYTMPPPSSVSPPDLEHLGASVFYSAQSDVLGHARAPSVVARAWPSTSLCAE